MWHRINVQHRRSKFENPFVRTLLLDDRRRPDPTLAQRPRAQYTAIVITHSSAYIVSSSPQPAFLGYSCWYYVPIEICLTRRIILNTMNAVFLYFVCLTFACAGVWSLSVYTDEHAPSLLTVNDDLTTVAANRGSPNRAKRDTRLPITPLPSNSSDGNITSKVST